MTDLIDLLSDTGISIAVVGATDNANKYGSVAYRDLKRKGYRVMAVNPNRDTVDGDTAYDSLADLPEAPDIVTLVVPPEVGMEVAATAEELGYERLWLQPGAESPALLSFIQDRDFDYVANACIMVRSRLALG